MSASSTPSVQDDLAYVREVIKWDRYDEKQEAQLALDRVEKRLEELRGVSGGVVWLDNNLHNYGSKGWRGYFKAVLRDARRALA